jgi:Mce-associated membrane protein
VPPQRRPPSGNVRPRVNPRGIDAATVRLLAARARRARESNGHLPLPGPDGPQSEPRNEPAGDLAAVSLDDPADLAPAGAPAGAPARRRRLHPLTLPVALAVVTVVLGGLAAWFAASAHKLTSVAPAQNGALTDSAATSQVSGQITSAVDALFSYDYANPGPTRAAAHRLLTGPAVGQYASLFGQVQREAPGKKLIVTTAVTNVGVEMLVAGTARVLVFAVETDRSASGGQPATAGAMLAVNAVLQGSTWKIEGIDTFSR